MSKKLLLRLTVLVAAMMCALGARAAEPYVIYTSSDSTLTFYCDNQVWSHSEGLLGQLNTGDNYPDWLNDNFQLGVAHVVFDPSFANARPRTMFAWFMDMTNLRTIEGWENLNTSHVTNMRALFSGCSKLTSVDLSHFNTEVVTDMGYMFYGCNGLTSLDLSSFITFRVTYLDAMFEGCSGLTSLDLSNFDTSSVTDMESMFSGCSGLTSLDLSGFNTTKVTNMAGLFYNCSNLITVYVSSAWSVSKVTHSTNMFRYCSRIVGGMGTTYDSNNVDKFYAHIDGGTDNPGYFTEKAGAVITVGNPYVIYTSSDSTLTFYYDNQVWSHPEGLVGELNTGDNYPNWLNNNFQLGVAHVVFDPSFANARQRTMFAWFKDMTNLRTIEGWENLNTSHVTNMR
ncbi:MAG: BspA family leucine-rich repeat surface protein, partial [Muribaculaceae bacterium]|nr:BspA family leucine-rich repeat surface protein [Muribaculaceae bacterium]